MKQKLLITGSCGFIMSNFIRKAIYDKVPYDIVSIDRISKSSLLNNIYEHKSHSFYLADICDEHIINRIFEYVKPEIVLHAAACSFVDDSLKNPNEFIRSNVLGTQVIVNACVKWGVKKLVYTSCYDEQTRAVTKNGFKTWQELKENELVLTINPDTGSVEEKPIKKIIVQDYDGDMMHFDSKRTDLVVTPNHRFICADHPTNEICKLQWYTAEELEISEEKNYLPRGEINKISAEQINVPNIGMVDARALFYLCGVYIGDGFTAYQEKITHNKSGLSYQERLKLGRDPKTGRFLKPEKRGSQETTLSRSYRIFFDVPENDKARKSLEIALTTLNIKYSLQKGKSGEHVYFGSKEWMEFFDNFGKYAKNKHIPEWMFNHGTDLLKLLWRGIHDSDGHGFGIKGRVPQITTVSEKLTAQLCYLGAMLGCQPNVGRRHCESFINGRKIAGDANDVGFANQRLILLPKPTRQQYKGKIWCLTVADNKNFLIERNGKIAFSGNTDEVMGALKSPNDLPWTEEAPLDPKNPYSASKASGELIIKAANNSFGLPYVITRASNNYGPRQSEKLIPVIIKSIMNNQKIPVYGNGSFLREWTFVDDNCDALLSILGSDKVNTIYNISSNQEYSNIEVVQEVCNAMGGGHNLVEHITDPRGNGHDFRYSVNCDKIKNELNWKSKIKFKDGIATTVNWYQKNPWFLK
jgi:dTDP-D-glucose 4,6-dehydratase